MSPPLPSSNLRFSCWAWRHMVWDIPLVIWGQLCCLCPLTTSYGPPAYVLAVEGGKQKRPWLCVNTAQQELKHVCIMRTVFSTNPKHSPISVTTKKINSFPANISKRSEVEPGEKELIRRRCLSFCCCSSESNSVLFGIKLVFPKSTVLPLTVIGKWSPCLYHDPWAFPFFFLPLSFWGEGVRKQLSGGLAANQGQPTTVIQRVHGLYLSLDKL